MKTKEKIEENMRDRISLGECFFGEKLSEADEQVYHTILMDIKEIIDSETSITAETKRFFEEVLQLDFDESQWLSLTLIISVYIDLAERRGANKVVDVLELGMR